MDTTTPAAPRWHAHCACQAVGLALSAAPGSVIHCHCQQCRRLSGSAFTTWASFGVDTVALHGIEHVAVYAASAHALRHFCRHCGTHVLTRDARWPDRVGVPAGILPDDLSVQPEAHYFFGNRAPWHRIGDTLPCLGSADT